VLSRFGVLAWVVVATTGCAQLFGIDKTSSSHAADAGTDADAAVTSSLTYTRYSVGATIVEAPLDLTGLGSAEFFTADGTLLPNTVTTGSTWSVAGASAQVDFLLPDQIQRTLALPDANILELFGVLEHPDSVAAPANATFDVSATLPTPAAAGESFQLLTLGSWTNFVLTTPAVGATSVAQTYAFSSVSSTTGGPLQAISPADVELLLRFDGDQLTGAFQPPAFDQIATPAVTISGAIGALAADATLSATIDPATALARMAVAVPATTAATSLDWSLVAAPGYEIASNSGVLLNAAAQTENDTTVSAGYSDTFTAMNWHPVFTWAPTASRTVTVDSPAAGALPVSMFTQLAEFMDASTGALDADLPAGQPLTVILDGMPLNTDNATLALDTTQALNVTFTADTATNTLYQLNVFLLVPTPAAAPTSLQFKTILGASALVPSFTLPANLLTVGQSYVVRAICISGGFPALANGDLTQRTLPLTHGLLDSGAFTVTAAQ
jgi:hypothetical protein